MMKRLFAVVGLVALFASGALAQDYIFTNFRFANIARPMGYLPCVQNGTPKPLAYDGSLWVFVTCVDDRVIARRLFPNGATNDYPLPVSPCALSDAVQPLVVEHNAWVLYTCTNSTVIAKQFLHPNDNVRPLPTLPTSPAPTSYDTTDPNWEGTGMTEAAWRARYPAPSR